MVNPIPFFYIAEMCLVPFYLLPNDPFWATYLQTNDIIELHPKSMQSMLS